MVNPITPSPAFFDSTHRIAYQAAASPRKIGKEEKEQSEKTKYTQQRKAARASQLSGRALNVFEPNARARGLHNTTPDAPINNQELSESTLENIEYKHLYQAKSQIRYFEGLTQGQATLEATDITALTLDPFDPNIIYAGTSNQGFLVSYNKGVHWQENNLGLESSQIVSVLVDPLASGLIYLATNTGFYRSSKWGENDWENMTSSAPIHYVQGAVINPQQTLHIYLVDSLGQLWQTFDGGQEWEQKETATKFYRLKSMGIHPESPHHIITITPGKGLIQSHDFGQSWTNRIFDREVRVAHFDPYVPGDFYAGKSNGGLFLSQNNGHSWVQVASSPDGNGLQSMYIDRENIYIGTNGNGLHIFNKTLQTWQKCPTLYPYFNVISLAGHSEETDMVYIGLSNHGIFRMTISTPDFAD